MEKNNSLSGQSERNINDIIDQLERQTTELSFIISGLETHEPFLKLIDKWRHTNEVLNDSWHLFTDPVRFNEARVTKFATMELINCLDNLRADLSRSQVELIKLQNSDKLINKDVDSD